MTEFNKPLWDKFNPSQIRAIKKIDGPAQICAVAGSGKTTVIVHRTEHMINDLKIDPKRIAMMTFTTKAAKEMEDRLSKLIDKKSLSSMFCGTSHSFGYRVLANSYKLLNHPLQDFTRRDNKNPGVLTGNSQKYFAEKVKDELLKLPWDLEVSHKIEEIGIKQFLSVISLCKNAGIDHIEYEQINAVDATPNRWAYIHFYKMYEEMKVKRKSIDLDDMLFLSVRLLREHPEILRKYQGEYDYIVIDETQDNNPMQYALASMIAKPQDNLFVVGDDDQSMYSFRGAEPNLFINFCSQYPNAEIIPLEDNYRSKPEILNVANKLISHNTNRIKKQLVAHNKDDDKCVFYSHYFDEYEEAKNVADEISNICNNPDSDFTDEINYNKIFVLYRTNAQSQAVEDSLISKGIPYVIHGGISFYERKEVKDILAYLSLVVDRNDNNAFKRVYNVPSRYLGKAFLDKITNINKKDSLWNNLSFANLSYGETNSVNQFKRLVKMMSELNEKKDIKIRDLIDFLMENGYEEHLMKDAPDNEEEMEENEIVEKLKFLSERFDTVKDMLEYVNNMTGKKKESINGVQLMTIHRSKGLEAHAIFGIGINEGLLPHAKSIEAFDSGDKPLAIEEERRLAYVMVTRAESLAYLSSTGTFNGRDTGKSMFIDEMELEITEETEENIIEKQHGIEDEKVDEDSVYKEKNNHSDLIDNLEEIKDLENYKNKEEIEKEKQEVEEMEKKAPEGYVYEDDPIFGRILKPIPIRNGKVSKKYF